MGVSEQALLVCELPSLPTQIGGFAAHWDFAFSDGKWETPTLRDMGFRCIPRSEFLARLTDTAHARPDGTLAH